MQDEWITRFVAQHACAATRKMYASDLRDLVEYIQGRLKLSLESITEEQAVAWRGELESRCLKPATISRKLAVARGLFKYLLDVDPPIDGLPSRNPFRRVRAARFDRTVGTTPCPAPDEVRLLLKAIGSRTPRQRRDLLMVLLMFNQGLRISEVVRLKRSSIRTHGRHVCLAIVGKGGSEIRSVLAADVAELLERHLRSLPKEQEYVFSQIRAGRCTTAADRPISVRTVRAKLRRYVLRTGLDPRQVRPHSGRVFFITQTYLKTRDLERVARAVGHRELGTTRRYLRLGAAIEDHPAKLLNLLPRKGE